MSAKNPRVVSLIASATEIVCALGFEKNLAGRSHECDYPASVSNLPFCTQPKFNTEGTSYEIDQRVKAILQEGLSVYRVDADKLKALKPDIIITQTQCEVCAVSLKDVQEALCQWIDAAAEIVSLSPNNLDDIWADIRRVAQALKSASQGEDLINRLRARMAQVKSKTDSLEKRPRVACVEWIDPLMAAGNWMPELVEMAGGINIFGEAGKHSPWLNWDNIVAQDPDVIVVLPCGFDIKRILKEMPTLAKKKEWPRLSAVKNGRVYITDGNQFFNRPGPRLVESLEILAEIFHPHIFHFGRESSGWIRYPNY